ncbi:MAG: arginine--tRNA ligase [Henriciella sp.]|nr:arginine--tRNA ligase [Henriciella sp.]MBO6694088.1 arginine--tRNA ligase [Henriciella sp.]
MTDLATQLARACSAAFEAEGLEPRWGAVKQSDRPELADFQCNGCMGAAKQAGMNPRELAAKIAPMIGAHASVDRVEVAGPGFLNIVVKNDALAEQATWIGADDRAGGGMVDQAEKVVVDFGGPNVAKPMHVGHLRSAVIGDTLVRLLRFLGDDVTGDVHLGDWGLQMGLLITAVMDEQPELPYFDAGQSGPFPSEPPVSMDDLSRLYPMASTRSKEDETYAKRAQEAVAEMQAGRSGYRALLQHFIDVSVAALKVDYGFLDVSFDLWKGESDVDPLIAPMIEELKEKGFAKQDEGAWIIDVAKEGENVETVGKDGQTRLKNPMPPFMLVNSRGATGYHATDLATIKDRVDTIGPDRILYVVDQRQALHFEQVYRASDKVGYLSRDQLEHLGFGTVNGADGKPFKTREGGTLRLADLNKMALDEATKRIGDAGLSGDIGADEKAEIGELVARAALRFADLQNQRTTNYVFDLARFTSFEGKTGPYLLYAAVRMKALLRRAADEGVMPGDIRVEAQEERKLVLALDGFALALHLAREKRMPHFVCEHVYGLSQAFSAFYSACPILKDGVDADTKASRIALCKTVLHQLEAGLGILGITAPERM